jgi:DNA replication and repair protein RecF
MEMAVHPGSWRLTPDASDPCGISSLLLQNFRNYQALDLSLEKGIVILVGPNGAGKTNVLEAISFFSPGRGLRGVKLSQATNLMKANQDTKARWVVSATVETDSGSIQLGTGLDYTTTGSERRLVKINGQPAKSQACLTDWVSVIWLVPQMDRLFLEGASLRRKFVDRMVYTLDPAHADRVHRYEHHLRERSSLLREGRYDPLWVTALERRLAEDGVAIAIARHEVVNNIAEAQSQEKDYPFPQFQAEMAGTLETWLQAGRPALAVEDDYAKQLNACRRQDGESGGASIGPHRSDFHVSHLAKQLPAELCSTGEQKMLLIAVTLAFTRVQALDRTCPTILLLDDIIAHLDDQHRLVLFQEICDAADNGSQRQALQVWMTGTDTAAFESLRGRGQFLMSNSTLTNGYT